MTAGPPTGSITDCRLTMSRALHEIVGRHVPRSEPIALIDFPTHFNVGDAAIWLGELKLFGEGGWTVRYACAHDDYDPWRLRERLGPAGTIVLNGGGNFGDLYPRHQELRERVIADHLDRRIVQMPQSLHFQDEASLDRAAAIIGRHPDLTVLARDGASESLARTRLGSRTALCPDAALALGPLPRRRRVDSDVLVLARRDPEGRCEVPAHLPPGVAVADWPRREPPAARLVRAAALGVTKRARHGRAALAALGPAAWKGYEWFARRLLRSGTSLLARGRTVVTDRLHGHILSLLLGIPHVIVPDRHGKLTSFHEMWTAKSELVHRAETIQDGVDLALRLGRGGSPGDAAG